MSLDSRCIVVNSFPALATLEQTPRSLSNPSRPAHLPCGTPHRPSQHTHSPSPCQPCALRSPHSPPTSSLLCLLPAAFFTDWSWTTLSSSWSHVADSHGPSACLRNVELVSQCQQWGLWPRLAPEGIQLASGLFLTLQLQFWRQGPWGREGRRGGWLLSCYLPSYPPLTSTCHTALCTFRVFTPISMANAGSSRRSQCQTGNPNPSPSQSDGTWECSLFIFSIKSHSALSRTSKPPFFSYNFHSN